MAGPNAVVTGGAMGIGKGIALALAQSGVNVAIIDLPKQLAAANETVKEIMAMGQNAVFYAADATQRSSLESAIASATKNFGTLDIAVGCVGGHDGKNLIAEETPEHLQRTIDRVLLSAWYLVQYSAKHMLTSSAGDPSPKSIVLIGSIMANWSRRGMAGYTMSKAALAQLGLTAAHEFAPQVRVNVVEPGYIDTPGERVLAKQTAMKEFAKRIPMQRLGTPDDVGQVVAFLCSEGARYVTGSIVNVDGGYTSALDLPSRL